ncbi:unnamed protein product [Meganyctiphanes norvegica]|uniref:PIN domain-containing protein n=1 Tax=Meganyctiphanes norvegica TaxID=48144 RepID=A0AAV2QXQ4_MEGNR
MDKSGKFSIRKNILSEKLSTKKSGKHSLLNSLEERSKIKLKWKPFGSSPTKLKTSIFNSKTSEINSGKLQCKVDASIKNRSSDGETKFDISNDSGISIKDHSIIFGCTKNTQNANDNIPTIESSSNISEEENSTRLASKVIQDKLLEKKLYEKCLAISKNKQQQQQQPQKEKNMNKSILDLPRPKLTAKRRQKASNLESLRATLEYEKSLALKEKEKSLQCFKKFPSSAQNEGHRGEIKTTKTSIKSDIPSNIEIYKKNEKASSSTEKKVLLNEKSLPGLIYSSSDDESLSGSNENKSKDFKKSSYKFNDCDIKINKGQLQHCDKKHGKSQSNIKFGYESGNTRNMAKDCKDNAKKDQSSRSEITSLKSRSKGLDSKENLIHVSQVKNYNLHVSEENKVKESKKANLKTLQDFPENESFEVMDILEELSQEQDQDLETDMEVDQHKQILTEINNYRGNITQDVSPRSCSLPQNPVHMALDATNSSSIFFVVDTNILLDDKMFLERLATRHIMGKKAKILIPYTVIQELDGLKKSPTVGILSQKAIVWCNNHFEKEDSSIQGQSFSHYRQTITKYNSNECDDRIRDCCLLLQSENGLQVCLITNDVNLRNKALLASVKAFSLQKLKSTMTKLQQGKDTSTTSEVSLCDSDHLMRSISTEEIQSLTRTSFQIISDTGYSNATNSSSHQITDIDGVSTSIGKPCKRLSIPGESPGSKRNNKKKERVTESEELKRIKQSLKDTLGGILEYSAKEGFGDVWLQVVLRKPPWTLEDIFACWNKHWRALFTDKFSREVEGNIKVIEEKIKVSSHCHIDEENLKERVDFLFELINQTSFKDFVCEGQPLSSDIEKSHNSISKLNSDNSSLNIYTDNGQSVQLQNKTITEGTAGVENIGEMLRLVGLRCTQIV